MKKARKQTASVKRDEAAMTWEEIGLALGYKDDPRYGAKVAFMFYHQAMKKIRKRPLAIQRLKELVEFRNSQRRHYVMPDWDGAE